MTSPAWLTLRQALALRSLSTSSPDEGELLGEWLALEGKFYDRFAFNVRLGEGRGADVDDPPAVARMWKACTQLRADCLARHGGDVDVIEVKIEAHVQVVTQVQRYARLARHELADVGLVRPLVVCRTAEIAVDILMHAAGGKVVRCPALSTL